MVLSHDDSGHGPVVVLLHGFPLDRTMWAEQVQALRPSYRVIAPDLRGHGASEPGLSTATMEEMADDVIALLDQLKIDEPVVIGGLSMGGYVTLAAVLKYPNRFRGLMLFDTRAGADTLEAKIKREADAYEIERLGSTKAVVDGLVPKLFAPKTQSERPDLVERQRAVMERTSPAGVANALRGMAIRPDRTGEIEGLMLPTLILVGEEDVLTPPSESQFMATAISQSTLVIIPSAGHMAPLENPIEANKAILAYLSSLQ